MQDHRKRLMPPYAFFFCSRLQQFMRLVGGKVIAIRQELGALRKFWYLHVMVFAVLARTEEEHEY